MVALPTGTADIILHGGKILTVDGDDSIQQAVAVRGNRLLAVGSDAEILPLAGPATRSLDLRGHTAIPGIVDIHAHLDREGLKSIYPSLEGLRSIIEIRGRIKELLVDKEPGEWVVTMPIGNPPNYADMPQSLAEGRFPNRHDLDQVAPDNPVYIKGIWTPWNVPPSVSVANTAALRLAGIDRNTESPDSSVTIEKDSDGEPTGVFIDTGRYPSVEFSLMRVVPRFTMDQRLDSLKESMRLYNSVGTTGTYEGHGVAPEVLQVYKAAWDAGNMTVRANLTVSPHWQSVEQAAQEMESWGHSFSGTGFGDQYLRVSGYFIQYGGNRYTAEARSSLLPYTGWAGFIQSYHSPDFFAETVRLAAENNLRVNTLVREPLEEVLDVFEAVDRNIPLKGRRWTLAHVLQTTERQLHRIRDMGLLVETIPLTELWLRGTPYLDNPDLADTAAAHRRYLEQGVDFSFGTDNKPYNPFATLWAAVARRERVTDQVLGPGQRLTRLEALRAFTIGGARFSFDEGRRGSLEPGKLADLAVLSGDLLDMPEEEIPRLESRLTMLGGRIVYQSEDF
ncbi:MAG: amidohydrolase [Chloroflexota bacterium]|nr:amidohydrolase [Chloroflexota bacterium]